jgi:hypothetical protein
MRKRGCGANAGYAFAIWDVVALGRKSFCGFSYIAFGQDESHALDEAVIEIE